jgi:ketosteroid isomerase-like protein
MKLVTATVAAFLLMAGMAFAQQSAPAMASKAEMSMNSMNVEQHLKDMEQKWAAASMKGDGDALAPMLSDNFVNLDSDGSVHNRAESIERTKKAKWEVNEISELRVNAFGDSAVVTGMWTGKGVDGMGKPIDTKERWVDTWVKKDGKWQWCRFRISAHQVNGLEPQVSSQC